MSGGSKTGAEFAVPVKIIYGALTDGKERSWQIRRYRPIKKKSKARI